LFCYRRRQRENQEDLLDKVNQATLQFLTKGPSGAASGAANGRKITDLVAYKSVNDLQHNGILALQVIVLFFSIRYVLC